KLVIAAARSYNAIFTRIEKSVQEYDLNLSEFGVLEMLLSKGEQPVQKIAEKILVSSGTITYVIDKLQKKELVYRKKCEKDRRIFYVSLTEKGKAFITNVFEEHIEFLEHLFSGLDEEYKKEIVVKLFTLQNSLK
ncbi:MAG: MarR family winged helix-turn-helix transcriptional regulator, partial [Lachnotalea sp.]